MNIDFVDHAFKKSVDELNEFPYRGYELVGVKIIANRDDPGKGRGIVQVSPGPSNYTGVATDEIDFKTVHPEKIASLAVNTCLRLKCFIDNVYRRPEETTSK